MKPNASPKQDLTRNNNSSRTLLKHIQDQLSSHSESPYLDSLVLLAHIRQTSKSDILAHPDPALTHEEQSSLEQAIKVLKDGTPLPYVLGEWEFFQIPFKITSDVLIPRPETEGLVELALVWLQNNPARRSCLEIGTGCGCIAISLARKFPDLKITATDISPAALQVARDNSRRHKVNDQIGFLEQNLLEGMTGKVDMVIANLPYIPTEKLKTLDVYKKEPVLALDGGQDGLLYIKKVLKNARKHIHPGGALFFELDEDCGGAALALAREVWPGITLKLSQDLAHQNRYLSIQCP